MAADAWKKYETFPEFMGDNTIDMDGDTFKMALFLSTSNCATVTFDEYGDLTNEHANGNGYTTGGDTLVVTWAHSTGTTTFDSDDGAWTASGGSIVARFAVIYDDTPTGTPADPLVCYSLLDNTPADVTVTDGNTLTVEINASGVFTITGMT
jgi:hypothetical protein